MMNHLATAAVVALLLGGASAAHAEFPTFEFKGFPITVHQLSAVDSGEVRERASTSSLTMAGMPVSPHQVSVVTPRRSLTEEQVAEKLEKAGISRVRFLTPSEYIVTGLQDGGWITLTVDSRTGEPK